MSDTRAGEAWEAGRWQDYTQLSGLSILFCNAHLGLGSISLLRKGGRNPGFLISFAGCRKVDLSGLGGGRCRQGSSTVEFAHTPAQWAKVRQGFPSQSAQTCVKGTVCLILEPTQGQRAGGEEEVVVLGQCWDCERPTLLV